MDLRRMGIAVYCLWRQPGLDLAVAHKLARAFREHRIEIVHAHQCTPWFYCALARAFYPAPKLILQEHGRFFPEVDKRIRRIVNRLVIRRLTHRFIAVSRDIRERLVRYEGLDRDEIQVVYNGVGPVRIMSMAERRQLRGELGLEEGDVVAGTVGRLDAIKNLPMFIDALVAAFANNDRLRGLIIGDGPEFQEIERRIRRHGAQDYISMAGYRNDVHRCMQCLDLFVLCSFSEGTSMALLEAMAAGVPAIVTAVGGNTEIVEDGTSGWVIPSESVRSLTARMTESVADREALRTLGRAGQQRIAQRFTFNQMIQEYAALYATLLPSRVDAEGQAQPGSNR
jgi:glycosyltransferase involved in cell wall biosynthesis